MYRYQIGTLYNENRTSWPEGAEYNWRQNTHELNLYFSHPKPIEVQAVKQGEAKFALVVQEDIISLVFRFGAIPWSDAPYTWHMVPQEQRTPQPGTTGEQRRMMTTFLINADNGILLAIRQTSLSPEFTRALHQAIRDQAERPFDQASYDRQLQQLQRRYSSQEMVKLAIARCKGGD